MARRQTGRKEINPKARKVGLYRISADFEGKAAAMGAARIAGVDEAGRGPLAGPVVAAAVILDLSVELPSLNDSKLLNGKKREALYSLIRETATGIGVGIVEPEEIDRMNIYQAARAAMKTAVEAVQPLPDYLLIDGNAGLDLTIRQETIVKGDRQSMSIAAASIIAKVTRDRIMLELHEKFPHYGFHSHKGYATENHREALKRHGPCHAHRKCFRGVLEPDQMSLFHTLTAESDKE
jgi:ribonuclease HII